VTAPLPAAVTRAAVLRVVLDEVRKAYDAARQAADAGLVDLHQHLGVTQLEIRLPGHTRSVAQITLSEPKPAFRIDEAAFLTWCQQEHPTEVETIVAEPVVAVRPAWRKALLARLDITDDGRVVDRDTDRILDFITVAEPPPPGTTLTFKTGGRDAVTGACRDGRLALGDLLGLPADAHRD
jgi:hypothetical protein